MSNYMTKLAQEYMQQNKAKFYVDADKCTGCGKCVNVCSGQVLKMIDGKPEIKDFDRFGWNGCWKCQHCMAVCPEAAISILGKHPTDSLPKPDASIGEQMDRLVAYRRSCRRYLDKNVDRSLLDKIIQAMENVPTGGNSMTLEMTIIDDMDELDRIWRFVYDGMEKNAARGYYSSGMSRSMYQTMKRSEQALRKDDLLFCGAPHLFIAHKRAKGTWAQDDIADCNIASAYFELICNAHGLGTTIMSYSASVINDVSGARKMLGIPDDHYMGLIIGFGYPEITYARGVQKDRSAKIHRFTTKKQ
jgi:NAD-dependent dihydropyrimidine dehydrogenase PreA subunit/nitroreductase